MRLLPRRSGPRPGEWGVGGINIPDYTTNMSGTDVKNKLGWQAGITTAVNPRGFAVEPQILYVRRDSASAPKGGGDQPQVQFHRRAGAVVVPPAASRADLCRSVFTVMNDCKQKSGGDLLDSAACVPVSTRWARSRCWAICW
ncbi:MAG: hypothetical protein ACLRMJ_05790 [Alistipes finegoldii]